MLDYGYLVLATEWFRGSGVWCAGGDLKNSACVELSCVEVGPAIVLKYGTMARQDAEVGKQEKAICS